MSKQPTFKRIIAADYPSRVAFLTPLVIWPAYFFLIYLQKEDLQRFDGVDTYAVLTLIALGVLAWRAWLIRRAFASGLEITGKISHIFFYRDIGDLKTSYTYQDQRYEADNKIVRSKQSLALKQDQLVVLVVDPKNPHQAFVRDLYVE